MTARRFPQNALVMAGLLSLLASAAPAQNPNAGANQSKVDAALETAAKTGRPVLFVGARDSCGLCKAFLSELKTDPKARAVTNQYVAVKLDIDKANEWRAATRKFPYKGGTLPILLVVRADGEQIYGQGGAPPQAAAFLFQQLKKAGTLLNQRQLSQLRESADKAQTLIKDGKIDQAIPLLKRHLGSGSYAAPAVKLQKLAQDLSTEGQKSFEVAKKQIDPEKPDFEAALALAETQKLYGKLPEVGDAIGEQSKELRQNDAWIDLLEQAELFGKAQAYAEDGKQPQAAGMFRRLQEKYPGSAGAEKAAGELAKLDETAKSEETVATTPKEPMKQADSVALKRAASFLRFGKTFQPKDAEKARKYFEKTIKTAPDSEFAEEAKKRLKQLP